MREREDASVVQNQTLQLNLGRFGGGWGGTNLLRASCQSDEGVKSAQKPALHWLSICPMSREGASGAHKVNQTNRRTDHKMLSVIVLFFRVKPVTPTGRREGRWPPQIWSGLLPLNRVTLKFAFGCSRREWYTFHSMESKQLGATRGWVPTSRGASKSIKSKMGHLIWVVNVVKCVQELRVSFNLNA